MKTNYKKYTQSDFADLFKTLDQPKVSRLLSGKDKVGISLAVELAELFPWKDIWGWKAATKEDMNNLYQSQKRQAELCLVSFPYPNNTKQPNKLRG